MDRRKFLKAGAIAGVGATVGTGEVIARDVKNKAAAVLEKKDDRKARIGFIGVGLRGRNHLAVLLRRDDIEIPAICDIDSDAISASQKMIREFGFPEAAVYTGSEKAF